VRLPPPSRFPPRGAELLGAGLAVGLPPKRPQGYRCRIFSGQSTHVIGYGIVWAAVRLAIGAGSRLFQKRLGNRPFGIVQTKDLPVAIFLLVWRPYVQMIPKRKPGLGEHHEAERVVHELRDFLD